MILGEKYPIEIIKLESGIVINGIDKAISRYAENSKTMSMSISELRGLSQKLSDIVSEAIQDMLNIDTMNYKGE
jgi:hypothetical protein